MDDAGLPPLQGQEARVPGAPGSKCLECNWTKAVYDIKTWRAAQKSEVNVLKAPFRHPALSFVGAPGDTYAEASLCYLGDIEISEDATLAELKSQVRLLPAASLGGALASPSEIVTYSSILFPRLQSVLIWHVLHAMFGGKYPAGGTQGSDSPLVLFSASCPVAFLSPDSDRHEYIRSDLQPLFFIF